jgi:hypothetical protein
MIYPIPHALINQNVREREWREGERKGVEMSEKEIRLRWMFPFLGSGGVACLGVCVCAVGLRSGHVKSTKRCVPQA